MPLHLAVLASSFLAPATIRTDFEGGSLGRVERISESHFRVGAKGEKDQDGRNRQANWYYFRVDGAPRTEMTFDVVDLPGEYNYQPNRGAITGDTPPVISYDGKTWTHVQNFEYDAAEPRLRLRIKPQRDRFWIAHCPVYTGENLMNLRRAIGRHPDFREEVIGKSVGRRDLLLWTVTKHSRSSVHRKTIWLMFRQHSWETGSSWVGEGAVRALLAETPAAEKLRASFIWKILPLCDPDGVARGGVRFNVHGFDLNRNWDVRDRERMPEISAQRDAVQAWIESGHTVDLFLSLHNTETSEYLEGPPTDDPAVRSLAERLWSALQATSFAPSRPLFFASSTTTQGRAGRMTVVQGLFADFQIPAFLMEQRVAMNQKLGRFPTIEDRLRFGAELSRAVAASLDAFTVERP